MVPKFLAWATGKMLAEVSTMGMQKKMGSGERWWSQLWSCQVCMLLASGFG